MSFTDVIKKSVLKGFESGDMSTASIFTILLVTLVLSAWLYIVYMLVNKNSMYDKEYHITMAIISVVTAGIIIAMQSNIVISLGMVGALSIVRFRTAIKSPLDLLFLFWSIGNGIICGAMLFEVATAVSLVVSLGIFIYQFLPIGRPTVLLIVNSTKEVNEEKLYKIVKDYSYQNRIKSRNYKKTGNDYIFELRTKQSSDLLKNLGEEEGIIQFSLLSQDGEIRV